MTAITIFELIGAILAGLAQDLPSLLSILQDLATAVNATPGTPEHTAAVQRIKAATAKAK